MEMENILVRLKHKKEVYLDLLLIGKICINLII